MKPDYLQWIARFSIEAGKSNEFGELAQEYCKVVETNESGTKSYQWYLNDEQTECVVTEWYNNSEAGIAHVGNVSKQLFPKLLKISKITGLEVYGNPSKELEDMLKGFGAKFFRFFTGFAR